ncbi:MAG: aminotransferase class I/II-fold pyridoxal phosphate-dependent enzyme [Nitrospirae bacterium]|jgi:threonine-phosphate decarboxylase|nr:aminotransferase class I/II-fold pyridoxal phosphate-dependent enzyme [Nitrospirota bacterium]
MKVFYVEGWVIFGAFLVDWIFGDPKKYHPVIVIGKLIEKIEVFLRNRKLNSRFGGFLLLLSVTKFYGLAGLRLGYGVSHQKLIEKLKNFSQPWNVNTLAQVAGTEIIKHKEFKRKSLDFFKQEKEFLEGFFYKKGIVFYPSVANFYLIEIPKKGVFQYMLERGILIRECSDFYGLNNNFIRVSVKNRDENEAFFKELKKFLRT